MHPTPTLRRLLRTIPLDAHRGKLYRVVRADALYGFDRPGPYCPRPLYNLGPPSSGARYTPKGGAPSLYLSADYETALRECLRIAAPARLRPVTPPGALVAYLVTVSLKTILDLTSPAIRRQLGTNPTELSSPWRYRRGHSKPPTQRLGAAVAAAGHIHAIRYRSTKSAGNCFAIFTDALDPPAFVEVNDPEGRLVERIP